MKAYQFPRRQSGAILVVSLLLLLVMTVLALSASNSTRLQERMAGNARDLELAFQGAEAGLREQERLLQEAADVGGMKLLPVCADASETGCSFDRSVSAIDYKRQAKTWWQENGRPYGDEGAQEFGELADDPLTRSEWWAKDGDSLTTGGSSMTAGVNYYVNVTRAVGGSESAEVVLQSVVAVPVVAMH